MEPAVISASAAILVASLGASLAYFYNQRLSSRQARLQRIDRQLSELYGPMYATLESNESAFNAFLQLHRSGSRQVFDLNSSPLSPELVNIWRLWVTEILQPGNRRVVELIKTKADLMVDPEIPRILLDYCAHVATLEVRIKQWERGEQMSLWSGGINYPGPAVKEYARVCLRDLKAEQGRLLNLPVRIGTNGQSTPDR